MPANAGIQGPASRNPPLDPRLRGRDDTRSAIGVRHSARQMSSSGTTLEKLRSLRSRNGYPR
jgi:hypothetical protein